MKQLGNILDKRMEKYQEKIRTTYTTVIHQAREKLGISLAEYCVADIIYHLSGAPKSRELGGWCYASKETIGKNLGISRMTVHTIINKLIKLGLLEKDSDTKHLRTTGLWYSKVVVYKERIKPTYRV